MQHNVAYFPRSRHIAHVRRVAETLDGKATDKAREVYWREVVRRIGVSLSRCGADRGEIERQVREFGLAVTAELCRRAS